MSTGLGSRTFAHRVGLTADSESVGEHLGASGAVNVKEFGATGGGVADDWTAIQAAINSIAGTAFGSGGTVLMPPGVYIINSQLTVTSGVRLVGAGVLATQIKAGGSFPTSTPLIRLGDGTGEVNSTRLEDLSIRCQNLAGSIGVYSTEIAEQSGLKNVRIDLYKAYGIKIEDTASTHPDNFLLRDIQLAPSDSATSTGLLYSLTNSGKHGGRVERITIASNTSGQAAGIQIRGSTAGGIAASLAINGMNVENHDDGILIDERAGAQISHIESNVGGTNLIHLASAATGSVVCTWLKRNPGTNTVKNDVTSVNITEADVSLYATNTTTGTICVDATNGFRRVVGTLPGVSSNTTIAVGKSSEVVTISGTTTITGITATYAGHRVTLIFSGALTMNNSGNIFVAGGVFNTTSSDTITVVCDGTNWYETGRSVN